METIDYEHRYAWSHGWGGLAVAFVAIVLLAIDIADQQSVATIETDRTYAAARAAGATVLPGPPNAGPNGEVQPGPEDHYAALVMRR